MTRAEKLQSPKKSTWIRNIMLVVYLTDDSVNSRFAGPIAHEAGAEFIATAAHESIGTAAGEFLVMDLDHLPAEFKRQLLTEARHGSVSSSIAVHSAELSDDEVDVLAMAGIAVERDAIAAMRIALWGCGILSEFRPTH